jgi:predicted patatin/cPLA2 family phospholipase
MKLPCCGLVLEGGGLRGNYSAGVLDAFLDSGIEFPHVIGVSAGAAYGCSYVSRQKGRNLEILRRFHGDPQYLSVRNYFTTGSFFGMDFVFNQIPDRFVPFDWKTFVESPVRFTAVCTDCESGEPVYFEKHEGMEQRDFFTTLTATSSMPYSSRMVKYQGKFYLDGAIVDAIPVRQSVSRGYGRNVVILTNPAGYRKKDEPHPPDALFYFGRKKLIRALKMRVTRYNESLEYAEEEERAGRTFIIRPSADLKVSRVETNKDKLLKLYELGIGDALALVPRLKEFVHQAINR